MKATVSSNKLFVLLLVLLVVDIGCRVFQTEPSSHASAPAQYKVVASPGRGGPGLADFENVLNDMARQGWKFDQWLYNGSAQTPDMIFKK